MRCCERCWQGRLVDPTLVAAPCIRYRGAFPAVDFTGVLKGYMAGLNVILATAVPGADVAAFAS